MGDKFCPVIVSTFSSAGPVRRTNIGQWLDGWFEGFTSLSGIFCKYSALILDLT